MQVWLGESISSGAQYAASQKYFSHPSLVVYFLCNPVYQTELEQHIAWGLLIANHMDQSIWWANQKHSAAARSYLLHSFLHVHSVVEHFTSYCTAFSRTEPKPFCWAKPAYFDFCSPNFTVQDHVLNTTGHALISLGTT